MKRIYVFLMLLLFVACSKENENQVINQPEIKALKSNEMGKVISVYNGVTASEIKSRADIPLQADMVVNGNTVDCSNLNITQIKNVLGESTTSLSGLCSSPNVNIWSGFSPIEWYIDAQVLKHRVRTPYIMGNFAGYNHQAPAPYANATSYTLSNAYANSQVSISCDVNLGEVDWSFNSDYCHIVVDGVIKASFPLSEYVPSTTRNVNVTVTAPAVGVTQTYNIQVWFGLDTTKHNQLTELLSTSQIRISVPATFEAHYLVNSLANRQAVESAEEIDTFTEYVSNIYISTINKTVSGGNVSGNYTVTAEIKRKSDNVYLRTINVGANVIKPSCTVTMYKINNGVTSSTYTVSTSYSIRHNTSGGGYAFSFAIPSGLFNVSDDDKFYLTFDNLAG